jgi:hypothetical protein
MMPRTLKRKFLWFIVNEERKIPIKNLKIFASSIEPQIHGYEEKFMCQSRHFEL